MPEKKIQRSLRIPVDLVREIEKMGRPNERNFSQQVIYMLRLVSKESAKEPASE